MTKRTSLILLVITALGLSRIMFALFNDPEGPNLLIVLVTAAIVYVLSLSAYLLNTSNRKKSLLAVLIQLVVVSILFYFLK